MPNPRQMALLLLATALLFAPTVHGALTADTTPPASSVILNPTNFVNAGTPRLSNGGFENTGSWSYTGSAVRYGGDSRTGLQSLQLGGNAVAGSAMQQVTLTAGAVPIVSFWYKKGGEGTSLAIKSSDGSVLLLPYPDMALVNEWTKVTYELSAYAGQSVTLVFRTEATGNPAPEILIDDVSVVEGASVFVPYPNTQIIHAYDAESGLAVPVFVIDDGEMRFGQAFSLSPDMQHTIKYQVADQVGNKQPLRTINITVDNQGPTGAFSINKNAMVTTSPNVILYPQLTDASQVKEIRIKSDIGVYGPWQPYQTTIAYTFASPTAGTKSICIQAQDMFDNSTVLCATIEYKPAQTTDIPHAKLIPAGSAVRLENKLVTAIFSAIPDHGGFYITEPDRLSSILVASSSGLPTTVGATVTVEGTTDTSGIEMQIIATSTDQSPAAPQTIRPLSATNTSIGGSTLGLQLGVSGVSYGLNSVGLLFKIAGVVTVAANDWFYIDDGSSIADGTGNTGVKVILPAGVTAPAAGSHVSITGISTIQSIDGHRVRVLKIRNASDIQ